MSNTLEKIQQIYDKMHKYIFVDNALNYNEEINDMYFLYRRIHMFLSSIYFHNIDINAYNSFLKGEEDNDRKFFNDLTRNYMPIRFQERIAELNGIISQIKQYFNIK